MYILLTALILTANMGVCIALRYAPFHEVTTTKQRKILLGSYIAASTVNYLLVAVCMYICGMSFTFDYLRYGTILTALVMTIVNIIVMKGKAREQLFVFGIVLTCNHLLLSVPNLVVELLDGFTLIQYTLIVAGLHLVLVILFFAPLNGLLKKTVGPFLLMDTGKYWNTIWFLPILYFGAKYIALGGEHNTGSVAQVISSILTGGVMIFMCVSIAADHVRLQERQTMERQLTEQKVHYKQLQTRVEEARKTRHDMKHHIAAIRHLVQTNNKEGVSRYCDELQESVQEQGHIPYTGNAAADGVLYHYIQRAAESSIDLQCLGTIQSQGISDMDICILLGNALDNALAGCMTVAADRRIRVICQSEEQLLSVVVRNTFDGQVIKGEEGLLSRKRNNAAGMGIRSMEDVCHRCGGSFEVKWEDNIFTVIFLLPLSG